MARHYYGVMSTTSRMMLCSAWGTEIQVWNDPADALTKHGYQVSLWTSREKAVRAFEKKRQNPKNKEPLATIVQFKVINV